MHRFIIIAVVLFTVVFPLCAQDGGDDTNSDGKADRWIKTSGGKVVEISIDRDYDGEVDYLVKYDGNSNKTEEQLDFNYDGKMDDFYYYSGGKMKRREIDTNYDERIDIWVYLDGIYINKYEKDTDFDGRIDMVEDYTEE